MTHYLMTSVSALALLLSAPSAIVTANAAGSDFVVAQATDVGASENAGQSGKEKGKKRCEDGTKPPCDAAVEQSPAAEPDGTGDTSSDAVQTTGDDTEAVATPPDVTTATTEAETTTAVGDATPSAAEPAAETQTGEQATGAGSDTAAEAAEPEKAQTATQDSSQSDQAAQKKKKKDDAQAAQAASESSGAASQATQQPAESDAAAAAEPASDPVTSAETQGAGQEQAPIEAAVETPPEAEEKPAKAATTSEATTGETAQTEAEAQPTTSPAEIEPAATATTTEEPDPAASSKAERKAERQKKKQLQGEVPAAAAADQQAEPVVTTSETVTEETTRSSNEEIVEAKTASGDKKDKSNDLIKILGAAAGGVVIGAILNEALSDGGTIVENTGDRVIVERDGQYYVRKDENEILRRPGSDVRTETFADGSSRTFVDRADGTSVVTIRDADGYVVQRVRILPDGQQIVLFDDTGEVRDSRNSYDSRRNTWIEEDQLPRFDPSVVEQQRYVEYGGTDQGGLRDVLMARPVAEIERSYTLRQVRENWRLRDAMPRLDLDAISFDMGSAAIAPDQARKLDNLGWVMKDILDQNPYEVFLIEGHTDAIGSRISNLVLSDRRAETVALALTEYYDIPPENLITQGYGEEFLKIDTQSAERTNRRAAVRRITPLLETTAQLQR